MFSKWSLFGGCVNPSGIDTFCPRRQPLEGEALMGVQEAGAGLGEMSKARALTGPRVIPTRSLAASLSDVECSSSRLFLKRRKVNLVT